MNSAPFSPQRCENICFPTHIIHIGSFAQLGYYSVSVGGTFRYKRPSTKVDRKRIESPHSSPSMNREQHARNPCRRKLVDERKACVKDDVAYGSGPHHATRKLPCNLAVVVMRTGCFQGSPVINTTVPFSIVAFLAQE